jgi:hypothetical protein
LFKLFSLYKGDNAKSISYDVGMIVALGSLDLFPFYLFVFGYLDSAHAYLSHLTGANG